MRRFEIARFAVALAVIAFVAVAAGCRGKTAPPVPTRTPPPTFTPVPAIVQTPVDPAAAATTRAAAPAPAQPAQGVGEQTISRPDAPQPPIEQPADTPAPPPAPELAAELVINSTMNVRQGPGTNYGIVGSANSGERYSVNGKNDASSWWQIDFRGQDGWVFGDLVSAQDTGGVPVAQNIPAPPPTAVPPTPAPKPEQPAEPAPPPEEQAPPANDNFPFTMADTAQCAPNEGNTYFKGFVPRLNNNLINAVCVHIAFYGPRGTKCSGCDGVGDGNWGFSPFGGPAPPGTFVEIFVVPCSGAMPEYGQTEQSGFGDLTQQSPKWTRTINSSEQCSGITFYRK